MTIFPVSGGLFSLISKGEEASEKWQHWQVAIEVSYVRIRRHLFRTHERVNSECDVCFVFVYSLEENDHLKAENRSLKKDLLAAIENSSTGEKKVALKSQ